MREHAVQTLEAIIRVSGQAKGRFVSSSPVLMKLMKDLLGIVRPALDEMHRVNTVMLAAHEIEIVALRQAAHAMHAASTQHLSLDCWGLSQASIVDVFRRQNRKVAAHMAEAYTPHSFDKLRQLCWNNGVFNLSIDPATGLAATAGGIENGLMHERRWVTDIVETMPLQAVHDPASVTRALMTVARFYATDHQQQSIRNCLADPSQYRNGNKSIGPAHIFYPDTLSPDPEWLANNRQESHAKVLGAICQRLLRLDDRGTVDADDILLAEVASSLTAFLLKINTMKVGGETEVISFAQSAGLWEEIPFKGGLTHDIYQVGRAFQLVSRFLMSDSPSLLPLQHAFHDRSPNLPLEEIEDVVAQAKLVVRQRLLGGLEPGEHPTRPWDAALFWVLQDCELTNGGDSFDEARIAFDLLNQVLAKLLRPFGIIRYAPFELSVGGEPVTSPDSYLSQNYWMHPVLRWFFNGTSGEPGKSFGSQDCSDPELYRSRAASTPKRTEAQWCWTSVAARAFIKRTRRMLAELKAQKRRPLGDEAQLIRSGIESATDLINRSFAQITGPGMCKSNGLPAPAWALPEAYELVWNVYGVNAALVGVNTPFGWGQSNLHMASEDYGTLLAEASAEGCLP